jgi:hypothetical protein
MKIQFFGGSSFLVEGKSAKVAFDPADKKLGKVDITTSSTGAEISLEAKKLLTLPGEYEISGVLVRGFHTHGDTNTVFKIAIDDIVVAHFGNLPGMPKAEFFDRLGENVDIALLTLRDDFDAKSAKDFLEKVDPRMVVFGGNATIYPRIVELFNAKVLPEASITTSRSSLPTDTTEFVILSV